MLAVAAAATATAGDDQVRDRPGSAVVLGDDRPAAAAVAVAAGARARVAALAAVGDPAAALRAHVAPLADVDRELVAGADRDLRDDLGAEPAVAGVAAVPAGPAD